MNVLHIGKYFPPHAGGMETYLRDLCIALTRAGASVRVIVHASDRTFRSKTEDFRSGEAVFPVTRAAMWGRLVFTPISITFGILSAILIRKKQPDIIHIHMPNVSAFWLLLIPRARRADWVIQWQSDVLTSEHSAGLRAFYKLYQPMERALLRRCKAIILASPPYLESSVTLRDFHAKCHVIPLGLDKIRIAPKPITENTQQPKALKVLCVGRLTYYKGFDQAIKAVANIDNTTLDLVGTGDKEASLRHLTEELGLCHRVRFHGHVSAAELDSLYADNDILCLPSIERTEAYGLVLLEAMHHGKPCICTDVQGSGMSWIVQNNKTGLVVPTSDHKALAAALIRLQQNRSMMHDMGEEGRDRFHALFEISRSAELTLDLYKHIQSDSSSES